MYAAIAQSGSILYLSNEYKKVNISNSYVFSEQLFNKGTEKRFAQNAAAAFGCPITLDEATLECLQQVDASTMNEKWDNDL